MRAKLEALERELADARVETERARVEAQEARAAAERVKSEARTAQREKHGRREKKRSKREPAAAASTERPGWSPSARRRFTMASGLILGFGFTPMAWVIAHLERVDDRTFVWALLLSLGVIIGGHAILPRALRAPSGIAPVLSMAVVLGAVPISLLFVVAPLDTYYFVPEGPLREAARGIGVALTLAAGVVLLALSFTKVAGEPPSD